MWTMSPLETAGFIAMRGADKDYRAAVLQELGISFVAAMQTAIFTNVEGSVFSSIMVTGNLRQAVEPSAYARDGAATFKSPSKLSIRRVQLALSVFSARPSA